MTQDRRLRIVFLCVRNAGRSQMAAAWARQVGGDRVEVVSGGSEPADEVSPEAVAAMAEVGIDISEQQPARFADEAVRGSDVVVTMGCSEECPYFPGVSYRDWDVADPHGRDLDFVREVRDDVGRRVLALMVELGVLEP
jgi:arsenate reductase